jgi:hypothetical protein
MVELLGPHRAILRSCVNEGATIRLVVPGEIDMDVVAKLEEADSRGFGFELGGFAPFLRSGIVPAFGTRDLRLARALAVQPRMAPQPQVGELGPTLEQSSNSAPGPKS